MAEQIVSPGVFQRETDQSFLTPAPVEVGAAIVGPTVRGPVERPTVVSSFADYKNKFGTTFVSQSDNLEFFTSSKTSGLLKTFCSRSGTFKNKLG